MRVLQVASEAFGLCKTGGLADAVSGLSRALVEAGDEVRLLLPAYPGVAARAGARPVLSLGDPLGAGGTRLLECALPGHAGVVVWLVDCPALYERPGSLYTDAHGKDHADNALRFALLARVAAMIGLGGAMIGWRPDVVHAHDWQCGLTPAYLALWGGRRPGTVFTIHNLAFAGRFGREVLAQIGLPESTWSIDGVEFHGDVSYMKAGLFFADRITTVSPSYAREIQTAALGEGFHGLLSARASDLTGIVNGVDLDVWDPRRDEHLVRNYGDEDVGEGKLASKRALQDELGLAPDERAPLFGLVGRLTAQKGIDLVIGALPSARAAGAQLAVLGTGDPALEQALAAAVKKHGAAVAFRWGYDEALSHRLIAASDVLLVPSRFEPCGLTQMYAMRYGTPPVVRRTGGLADTVLDADASALGNGFSFESPQPIALAGAIDRAIAAWAHRKRWRGIQQRAMSMDNGWTKSAVKYRAAYRDALG